MQTSIYYDHQAMNEPAANLWQHRRKEHNLVKTLLLNYALRRTNCNKLVDLACGKGGDLNKYATYCPNAKITCVDLSPQSLKVLLTRSKNIAVAIDHIINDDAAFAQLEKCAYEVAVMNFALHYFCDSKTHAHDLLQNISQSLITGGLFIGTCIDYKMLKHNHKHIILENDALCDIAQNPWGRKYRYTLDKCVDAEEYVVYFPELLHMAHSLQLNLVKKQSFNGFLFANNIEPFTPDDNMPYIVFVFVKS